MPPAGLRSVAPAILLCSDDPSWTLSTAEALVDFFPEALLTLPSDSAEAIQVAVDQKFDLAILNSRAALTSGLLDWLAWSAPLHVLTLVSPETPVQPGSALELHQLPDASSPRETALAAAALLGVENPVWNSAWSEALRLIARERLSVRILLRGPDGLTGSFFFVRGVVASARATDQGGRSYSVEDLLYVRGLEFQTFLSENVQGGSSGGGLESVFAASRSCPAAAATLFPSVAPRALAAVSARAGTQITVSVVEDDQRFRAALCRILETQPDFQLLDDFRTGEEAFPGLLRRPPAVALVDLRLPGLSGLQLVARLAAHLPQTSFLAFSSQNDDYHVAEFLRSGGAGYLLKGDLPEILPEQIRTVAHGGTSLSPGIARKLLHFFALPHLLANPAFARLAPADENLLRALSEGGRPTEIAARSGLESLAFARRLRFITAQFAATCRAQALADVLSIPASA